MIDLCHCGSRRFAQGIQSTAQLLLCYRLSLTKQRLHTGQSTYPNATCLILTKRQILTNLALVCTCSTIYGLQRLLYGPLRPIEIEQLSEKAWYAVLDTLLAMPSLRDDVGGWLLAIFVLLLAGKVWGWIAEGRLDILEQQPPDNPRLFHIRLASSLLLSVVFDALMFNYCLKTVMDDPRPGMMVIFTFEFAILTIFSLFTASRYILTLIDTRITTAQTKAKIEERKAEIRQERQRIQQAAAEGETPTLPSEDDVDEHEIDVPGWEEKRRWLFGLELATDFIKIIVYTIFFTISLTFIGLPMHIMRDVYLTFASFTKRLQDYSNYRKATQDMNTRYPDATQEELGNDNTCIICREAMIPWEQPTAQGQPRQAIHEGLRAKKLPCGHILHLRCLKSWLERQQACPTCRRPVIAPQAARPAAGGPGNQPGVAGVPGAAGVQGAGAANGQDGAVNPADAARQQRARHRLRWLNMGPVRIGFYNGPANQVNEALRNANPPQPATGPAQIGLGARNAGAVTTQAHLRAAELRLLQQAQELGIEQAQLANVRALEAELARLRAQYAAGATPNAQPPPNAFQPHANAFQQMGQMPFQRNMFMPPPMAFPPPTALPQAFQPPAGQQSLGPGHADLPDGLSLPEGWTLTPLQRVGAQMPIGAMSSQAQPANGVPNVPASMQPQQAPIVASEGHASPIAQADANGQQTSEHLPSSNFASSINPSTETDMQQVSSSQGGGQAAAESIQPTVSSSDANQQPSAEAQPQPQPQPTEAPRPWNTSSWDFGVDGASASTTTSSNGNGEAGAVASEDVPEANGHAEEQTAEAGSSSKGKGKGKAVEVEEVKDFED